ncbi:MAG: DNA polymerase III subunit delta [bacterium]
MKKAKGSVGKLTPAQFEAAVSAGESFPCVLLMGEEDYLLRKVEQVYLERLLPSECRDFDLVQLTGDVPAYELRESLGWLPLMGSYCVLHMDSPAQLKDDAAEILRGYLKAPSSLLRIVLSEPPTKRRLKDKLREKPLVGLLSLLTSVHFPPLEEAQLVEWVIRYVKERGKRIAEDVALYLAQISTNSLRELAAKLDHAMLFVGDAKDIDIFTIQRISGITSEFSIFDLENAFQNQSLRECLHLSRRLLDGGETVLRLVNHLHKSLTLVWQIQTTLGKKGRDETQRKILGKRYFVKDKGGSLIVRDRFIAAARSMPMPMIERGLLGLLDLEITLKTRVVQEDVLFYHWLCDVLTHGQATTEPKVALES